MQHHFVVLGATGRDRRFGRVCGGVRLGVALGNGMEKNLNAVVGRNPTPLNLLFILFTHFISLQTQNFQTGSVPIKNST